MTAAVCFNVNKGSLQCMNDSGNVTKDCQQDVDQEVSTTSALEEYTKRGQEDGENDLANVATRLLGLCSLTEFKLDARDYRTAYLAVKGILNDFCLRRLIELDCLRMVLLIQE